MRVVVAEDRVVGRQDRAAAVAEDRVDALVGEDLITTSAPLIVRPGERVAEAGGGGLKKVHGCL